MIAARSRSRHVTGARRGRSEGAESDGIPERANGDASNRECGDMQEK